jgi:UDP-N-acetyl-D-glucosamine dehydrogenase
LTTAELRRRIEDRKASIAVIGCGYVGLPLALAYAEAGFRVIGVDIDASRVAALSAGKSYILDVAEDRLSAQVRAGRIRATTDPAVLRDADVIFVAVPTPFDRSKQPDLSFVIEVARQIAKELRHDQLVILESTTFPGTTDEVLRPILEASGLKAGSDFYLAFSPERIDPGSKSYRIDNTPKVVGGVDEESTALAVLVLQQVITASNVHPVSSPRVAEMTKLLENTFRAVNIALVNELAVLCDRMGLDVWEVIGAAATKPYGFMPFFPGPGVGGHCIPVDPYYLAWKAREYDFHTKFIELAAETNLEMPFFTVDRIRRLLNRNSLSLTGAKILVLGVAFKKDIDDARNSPAIRVIEILRNEGAAVSYHDPFVPEIRVASSPYGHRRNHFTTLQRVPLDRVAVARADCVVILVAHSAIDYRMILSTSKIVFDAVNATAGTATTTSLERL